MTWAPLPTLRPFAALVVTAGLAACGDNEAPIPGADAGAAGGGAITDGGRTAAPPAPGPGLDATTPAPTRDAGADAATAGLDAGSSGPRDARAPDATVMAGDDAAGITPPVDAGSPPDATTDATVASPDCDVNNGGCDGLTVCSAVEGGVTCGACPQGYAGDGHVGCSDIDECATDNGGCGPFETCENKIGSSPTCTDIDECATDNGGCDPLTTCTDRVADAPMCGPCPTDYDGDGYTGCALASGRVRWVERIADPVDAYLDQYAFAVAGARDGSGFAVAGRYDVEAIFAPGTSRQVHLADGPHDGNAVNDVNAFVARYDDRGRLSWVARSHDFVNAAVPAAVASFTGVVMLTDGSTVATGYHGDGCSGTCTTILGLGEPNETSLTNTSSLPAGAPEILLARHASDGRLVWARSGISVEYGRARRVTRLADDSVVVVGEFTSSTTLGQGEPAETTLTASAQVGGLIARYRADGSLAWARQTAGSCFTLLYAVAALPDGAGVIVGGTRGLGPRGGCDVVLDAGQPGEQRLDLFNDLNRIADYEPFLARLDEDGNAIWIEGMRSESGHTDELAVHALASDAGGVYVTGSYGPPMVFAEGTAREARLNDGGGTFLARYGGDGALDWVRNVAGYTSDIGTNLAVDDAGRPVMTGEVVGTTVFGAGEPGETELTVPECYVGSYSAGGYAASYDASGTLRWARAWQCAAPRAITAVAGGPLVSVGTFWNQTTLGAGEPFEATVDDQYFSSERDGLLVSFRP